MVSTVLYCTSKIIATKSIGKGLWNIVRWHISRALYHVSSSSASSISSSAWLVIHDCLGVTSSEEDNNHLMYLLCQTCQCSEHSSHYHHPSKFHPKEESSLDQEILLLLHSWRELDNTVNTIQYNSIQLLIFQFFHYYYHDLEFPALHINSL